MKRRRGSKNDYLAVSDRSGFTFPASEMVTQWDGLFVHRNEVEERNPQEFVRARRDPKPLKDVRPQNPSTPYCPQRYRVIAAIVGQAKIGSIKIGREVIDTWPYGSIGFGHSHYTIATSAADPFGMKIGCTFQVYPE